MQKMLFVVAGVLLLAGAAFALKSPASDPVSALTAGPSAFALMSTAKDLPVAPHTDAI
jgi:hypothetical protein